MRLFTGTFHHSLDAKGRLTIPNKLRILTPEGGTLAEAAESCIHFFPPEAWQRQVDRMLTLDDLTEGARDAQRKFFASAEECQFDRQGRIIIPVGLRQNAGIKKDVAVVGVGTKIEIWNLEGWRIRKASIDAEAPNIFERASRHSTSPT